MLSTPSSAVMLGIALGGPKKVGFGLWDSRLHLINVGARPSPCPE